MAGKIIYKGNSPIEAAKAVAARLRELDKKREEWRANRKNQQLVQSSEVSDVNVAPSSETPNV